MKIIQTYGLRDQYEALITLVRWCAPLGLNEVWGVTKFEGIPDFRLNLTRYRVIELAPMPARIGVYMEWSKVFGQPDIYANDPDFNAFEDAFAYLAFKQIWNVYPETDLSDPYVETFLKSGMNLMVKEIKRRHPTIASTVRAARGGRAYGEA